MNHKLFEFSYTLKKKKQRQFFLIVFYLLMVYVLINVCLDFLAYPVRQKSNSMESDIPEGSVLLVTPLKKTLERGDVVLLKAQRQMKLNVMQNVAKRVTAFFTAQQIQLYEDSELPGSCPEFRRVLGMPGDTIYMRDYVLYIKPANEKHFLTEFEVIENPYNVTFIAAPANWDNEIGVKGFFNEIVLGPDEYFVLGDNRKSCSDSRLWGPVSSSDVQASALFCYFPFNSFKRF